MEKKMKKIGILFGDEQSFPQAVLKKINSVSDEIRAEVVKFDIHSIDDLLQYDVIFDRISNKIEFYRGILKSAVLSGIRIVNEPFFACADDNFFNATLAMKLHIKTPKTVIIPSKEHPDGINGKSFSNLAYPLDWDKAFDYVRFPAILKPNKGEAGYNEYKIYNEYEFFSAYDISGKSAMVLQEYVQYDQYFRCYTIGADRVRLMSYNPSKPMHLRYEKVQPAIDEKLKTRIEKISKTISKATGLSFNSVEIAVKDNEPYVIEFLNLAPNADLEYLHQDNFNWLVENTAEYLISLAAIEKKVPMNYPWSGLMI